MRCMAYIVAFTTTSHAHLGGLHGMETKAAAVLGECGTSNAAVKTVDAAPSYARPSELPLHDARRL